MTKKSKAMGPVRPLEVDETDGIQNLVSGLGEYGKDKRESSSYVVDLMSYDTLMGVYRASDLAAKIVDQLPDDMTRECPEMCIPDDEKNAAKIDGILEDLDANSTINQALKWRNAFGGAVVLVGANDGSKDLSLPLNEKSIKSIDFLNVFDAWEAQPIEWQENPLAKDFSKPTMFRLNPHSVGMGLSGLQKVHASRCLVFPGPLASRKQIRLGTGGLIGWGDSRLVRCIKLIRDYDAAWAGVASSLQEFVLSIYKLKGLAAALMADKDKTIKRRFQMMKLAQSMIKATLIDADNEEITRAGTPMAGVSDALREFQARLAAAADMPVSKLFGTSSGGLNSTGQAEERMWYDHVRARQHTEAAPAWNRLVELVMLTKGSPTRGAEPEDWSIDFPSLWQPTEVEQAAIDLQHAQSDQIYWNLGVASTEDIALSLVSRGTSLKVDLEAAAERAELEAEARVAQHEATVTNLEEHGQPTPPKPAPEPPAAKGK